MRGAIVLKSTGYAGLGDLLLALERALMLAQSSSRALVVDWRDTPYGRSSRNLFEDLFSPEWNGPIPVWPVSQLQGASTSVEPRAWRGLLQEPLRSVYNRFQGQDWNRRWAAAQLDAGGAAAASKADWVVLWDHTPKRPPGPSPLGTRIRPSADLRDTLARFKQQHFTQPMLGVHVRDTSEAQRAGKRTCPLQLLLQIDRWMAQHPGQGLFVACDNSATLAAIRERHPRAVSHSKWMPAAGEPLHLACHQGDGGLQVARDALLDIWLLASCAALVYPAQSSFSCAAASLSGLPASALHPVAPQGTARRRFSLAATPLWGLVARGWRDSNPRPTV
jgi:hypothetical protein